MGKEEYNEILVLEEKGTKGGYWFVTSETPGSKNRLDHQLPESRYDNTEHPESQKLYIEQVTLSHPPSLKEVSILSGLQPFVPLEGMKGKVLVLVNLKARRMGGVLSQGMLVCASETDGSKTELIVPEGEVGERIKVEGHEELFSEPADGEFLPVLNPKKKILEKCLEFFRTDENGNVVWKNYKLKTNKGTLKASIKNGLVS